MTSDRALIGILLIWLVIAIWLLGSAQCGAGLSNPALGEGAGDQPTDRRMPR